MMKQTFISNFFKPANESSSMTQTLTTSSQQTETLIPSYVVNQDYKYARLFRTLQRNRCDATISRKGLCYCAYRNFSDFAVYTTKDQALFIQERRVFVPKGTRIAYALVDDNSALEHIHVDTPYQRQGIGKNLIRFINKHVPKFIVFGGTEHNSRYRLTNEGAALIHACEKAKILTYDQIIESTVPPSPSIQSPWRSP